MKLTLVMIILLLSFGLTSIEARKNARRSYKGGSKGRGGECLADCVVCAAKCAFMIKTLKDQASGDEASESYRELFCQEAPLKFLPHGSSGNCKRNNALASCGWCLAKCAYIIWSWYK